MPNSSQQIKKIQQELQRIFTIFITKKIPLFEVLKKEYLPEGLKPHTRSICWLAEQGILQNIKKFSSEFGLSDFEYPDSDISPWDAKFKIDNCSGGKNVFVNVKVTDSTKPIRKNDIASVKALLNFYKNYADVINPDFLTKKCNPGEKEVVCSYSSKEPVGQRTTDERKKYAN